MAVLKRYRTGLREEVLAANLNLVRHHLVTLTWGNASGIDRASGLIAIKASGVPYDVMRVEDIVIVSLDGEIVEGDRRPSTDTPTHLELYRNFEEIGGIVHTHSKWATSWAQAEREIPVLGTTHADFSPDPIPLARHLRSDEIDSAYELNTGVILSELIRSRGAEDLPAALVPGHGPFCWGKDANQALERAVTLEAVAEMAFLSLTLRPDVAPLASEIITRHFTRKHGPGAYYGQLS
jgi:L-ribulose-5-phosphate 4-epimerase